MTKDELLKENQTLRAELESARIYTTYLLGCGNCGHSHLDEDSGHVVPCGDFDIHGFLDPSCDGRPGERYDGPQEWTPSWRLIEKPDVLRHRRVKV